MQVAIGELQSYQLQFFQPTYMPLHPPFDASAPTSAVHPLMNLQNKYYPMEQLRPIGRTNPPVPKAITREIQGAVGGGSTYRTPDEWLRQYALGAHLANLRNSFYQTVQRT